MSAFVEVETLEGLDFKWGKQRGDGGINKDVCFYETFTYDGMDYALNDCVFMDNKDEPPHIGKLVEIWENSDKVKKVKVQWFFRPLEISSLLGDVEMMENEILFASGDGTGLTDINPLEVISGKCNVVCISKDSRNSQPSAEEVQMADYIFYRTFDVNSNTISDLMGDTVGGLDVKHVFNRTESLRALDVCNLNQTGKDVIACGETQEATGKNSLVRLEILKPDENEDLMLGKKGTNVNEMQAKHGGLLGEGSSGGNVNSSKIGKIKGIILEKKILPTDKNVSEKDKFKDIKLPVSRVKVEEGVKKSGRDVGDDSDYALSKKAKLDGPVSSLEIKNVKRARSLTSSQKATSELDKNLDGSEKDVNLNLDGKSSFLDENLSKTSAPSRKKPRFGHAEDLSALKGKQSKGNDFLSREKPKVAHSKEYVGAEKGKKVGENWGAPMKRPSKINVVSPSVAERLITHNRSTFLLKRSTDLSKDKSNIQKIVDYENMNKLADDSRPLKGSFTTKGKLYDIINRVSEKTPSNEANNSSRLAINDYTTNSKHCKVALKEHLEGGSSKKGKFDDIYCKNNGNGNVKEKTCLSKIKNSPKDVDHENTAKSNLGKGASKDNFDGKVGKPFKNNLPTPSIVKCNDDDGKVGRRIFEVTRRPIVEKSNWMKLPWENKMKTAHDQGRLVLLQNLDPEYTSGEVEDIVWHAFKEESTAKMVQQTAMSNPFSGQAFVIFKSREAVDRVVKKLEGGCLMLPNKRPLVVSNIYFPKFLEKQTFVGHLAIDKARSRRETMLSFSLSNEAVSTSHYSQTNTIEYDMAMSWCHLQSKSDSWRKMLYKHQTKEIKKLADNLKLK